LRDAVRQFMQQNNVIKRAVPHLPDIRNQFQFRPRWRSGEFEFEEISGPLGVPGKVMTHRDELAQRAISSGTGEHAGHRIGVQFGPPGDARNMALQNANMNTYAPKSLQPVFQGNGASYLKMEKDWAHKLQAGYGIRVKVRDKYRVGEDRPISREVEWTEISPNGVEETKSITFGNFSSPQMRNAVGQ
ncbi:MAG TPA: DNA/RNA non-specific endonuclease, partial [Bryobacteraceae bacterium]|nr:DNA/RNA non-specific endonuclease [Bryobacteraceae bacterium]